MEIAFERHATSKIRSAKDLEVVKSMGFRGEALASIAAIARVELTSKTEGSELGYKIVVEGGNVISKEIVGCPKGTTIVVENLFYNTPVRYKFLKKDFTELGYIEDTITRIALVNPDIAIKLVNLGKNIIQTTGNGNLKDVVYSIFGKETAENIINVDYEFEDMKITGCVGNESISKNSRANQLFFVNKRFVKDKTLSAASDQAFREILPAGKYGFLILNVEIDSSKIDVNVHPAKLEIRFQEENKIFKLVYHAIKDAFSPERKTSNDTFGNDDKVETASNTTSDNSNSIFNKFKMMMHDDHTEKSEESEYKLINIVDYDEKEENSAAGFVSEEVHNDNLIEDLYNMKMKKSLFKDNIEEIQDVTVTENKDLIENGFVQGILKNEENNEMKVDAGTIKTIDRPAPFIEEALNKKALEEKNELSKSFEEMYAKTFGSTPSKHTNVSEEPVKVDRDIDKNVGKLEINTAEDASIFKNMGIYSKVKYKFIGIIFASYIAVEIEDELYIIDQKSANQSIVYEKIKQNYYSDSYNDSQQMLLPDIIQLTPKQMDIARDNMHIFEKAGFSLEEFGENTIKLSGAPEICMEMDNKVLFIECLDKMNTIARNAQKEIEEKFIETLAWKVAENTKDALTYEEVDGLMQKLLNQKNPFNTNIGKSIAIRLSKEEIDKKFN